MRPFSRVLSLLPEWKRERARQRPRPVDRARVRARPRLRPGVPAARREEPLRGAVPSRRVVHSKSCEGSIPGASTSTTTPADVSPSPTISRIARRKPAVPAHGGMAGGHLCPALAPQRRSRSRGDVEHAVDPVAAAERECENLAFCCGHTRNHWGVGPRERPERQVGGSRHSATQGADRWHDNRLRVPTCVATGARISAPAAPQPALQLRALERVESGRRTPSTALPVGTAVAPFRLLTMFVGPT